MLSTTQERQQFIVDELGFEVRFEWFSVGHPVLPPILLLFNVAFVAVI